MSRRTSKVVAKVASKILKSPAPKPVKKVAGSALSQRAKK